jgi:flagellar biosynthesis protein FliR
MTPRQGNAVKGRKFLSTIDDRQASITSSTRCSFVILLQLASPVVSSFLDVDAALTEMRRGVLSNNPSETINL